MKKVLCAVLFALTAAVSISACAEEGITPSMELTAGGGGISDPK